MSSSVNGGFNIITNYFPVQGKQELNIYQASKVELKTYNSISEIKQDLGQSIKEKNRLSTDIILNKTENLLVNKIDAFSLSTFVSKILAEVPSTNGYIISSLAKRNLVKPTARQIQSLIEGEKYNRAAVLLAYVPTTDLTALQSSAIFQKAFLAGKLHLVKKLSALGATTGLRTENERNYFIETVIENLQSSDARDVLCSLLAKEGLGSSKEILKAIKDLQN